MREMIEILRKELKEKDLYFQKNAKDLSERELYKLLGYMEGLKHSIELLERK